jgi:hypothetical protein
MCKILANMTQVSDVAPRPLVCLFDCLEPHEQFISYLAAATITSDRASNLDLCLALMAFGIEGSFNVCRIVQF